MSAQVERPNVARNERNPLYATDNMRNVELASVALDKVRLPLPVSSRCSQPKAAERAGLADHRERPQSRVQELRGKRHYSFSVDDRHAVAKQRRYSDRFGVGSVAFGFRRRGGRGGRFLDRTEKFVLPTKFLLGGSITDPLNLNSLCDEAINRSMNAATPMQSPLPVPNHRLEVRVVVPVNSADPLNLSSTDADNAAATSVVDPSALFRKRRKTGRKKQKRSKAARKAQLLAETAAEKPLHIMMDDGQGDVEPHKVARDGSSAADTKVKRVIDHIVSPVIPQNAPKWRLRRRTVSESRPSVESSTTESKPVEGDAEKFRSERVAAVRHKKRSSSAQQQSLSRTTCTSFRPSNARYANGNYSNSRMSFGMCNDARLGYFPREMFAGKDVLDVGCGAGDITLSVARDFGPRSVTGIDIDGSIIAAAKKNKQHYISSILPEASYFPMSFKMHLGPLAAPRIRQLEPSSDVQECAFPWNISFVVRDYVPTDEADVDRQTEVYDVILALDVTRWIHLNNGDAGLKRTFRCMFRQLRPGGQLVLEAGSWKSYRKKKKLTEKVYRTYQNIKLRPEQFRDYLLSPEVGFTNCALLNTPSYRSKGLKNPILVFMKPVPVPVVYFPHHDETVASSTATGPPSLHHRYTPHTCSRNCTPDCGGSSSYCWQTPQFDYCSSCCSTPCSTQCHDTPNFPDDTQSPYSSGLSMGGSYSERIPSSPSPWLDRAPTIFATESANSPARGTDPLDMILSVRSTIAEEDEGQEDSRTRHNLSDATPAATESVNEMLEHSEPFQ